MSSAQKEHPLKPVLDYYSHSRPPLDIPSTTPFQDPVACMALPENGFRQFSDLLIVSVNSAVSIEELQDQEALILKLIELSRKNDLILQQAPGLLVAVLKILSAFGAAEKQKKSAHDGGLLQDVFPMQDQKLLRLRMAGHALDVLQIAATVHINRPILVSVPCLRVFSACLKAAASPGPNQNGFLSSLAPTVLHIARILSGQLSLSCRDDSKVEHALVVRLLDAIVKLLSPADSADRLMVALTSAQTLLAMATSLPMTALFAAPATTEMFLHSILSLLNCPYEIIREATVDKLAHEAGWNELPFSSPALERHISDYVGMLWQARVTLAGLELLHAVSSSVGMVIIHGLSNHRRLLNALVDIILHVKPGCPREWQEDAKSDARFLELSATSMNPIIQERRALLTEARYLATRLLLSCAQDPACVAHIVLYEEHIVQGVAIGAVDQNTATAQLLSILKGDL